MTTPVWHITLSEKPNHRYVYAVTNGKVSGWQHIPLTQLDTWIAGKRNAGEIVVDLIVKD